MTSKKWKFSQAFVRSGSRSSTSSSRFLNSNNAGNGKSVGLGSILRSPFDAGIPSTLSSQIWQCYRWKTPGLPCLLPFHHHPLLIPRTALLPAESAQLAPFCIGRLRLSYPSSSHCPVLSILDPHFSPPWPDRRRPSVPAAIPLDEHTSAVHDTFLDTSFPTLPSCHHLSFHT